MADEKIQLFANKLQKLVSRAIVRLWQITDTLYYFHSLAVFSHS